MLNAYARAVYCRLTRGSSFASFTAAELLLALRCQRTERAWTNCEPERNPPSENQIAPVVALHVSDSALRRLGPDAFANQSARRYRWSVNGRARSARRDQFRTGPSQRIRRVSGETKASL